MSEADPANANAPADAQALPTTPVDPLAPDTAAEENLPADAQQAAAPTDAPADPGSIDQFSIDELLSAASFEDPSKIQGAASDGGAGGAAGAEFKLPSFQQVIQDAQVSSIDLLRDVELNVKIELGRSRMMVEDVLKLNEGSVVELDKLAGDPVDVFVNDRLVARGEVLVLNDNFCVRVNEIVAGAKEEVM
jgi:flagellar motor switch protein FliN/FliY